MFLPVESDAFFQMDGKCWMWEPLEGVGLVWKIMELCRSRNSGQAESTFSSWMGRALPAFPEDFMDLENSLQEQPGLQSKGSMAFPNGSVAKLFQLEIFPLLHRIPGWFGWERP